EQLGPEFVFVNKKMDWSNAQRYCREKFTDLATVRSLAEHQEVRNKTTGSSVWIGLFRHPDVHWSDGSGYSFKYWDSRPNPFGSSSKICGVSASRIGRWRAMPCDERLAFVCYGDPP
ncbi:macrophage mannose receptor 1-like, partial [Scomber scombrus]